MTNMTPEFIAAGQKARYELLRENIEGYLRVRFENDLNERIENQLDLELDEAIQHFIEESEEQRYEELAESMFVPLRRADNVAQVYRRREVYGGTAMRGQTNRAAADDTSRNGESLRVGKIFAD